MKKLSLILWTVACVLSPLQAHAKGKKPVAKRPVAAAKAATTGSKIVFETNKGKFVVRLFEDKAPLSAKNMLDYVQAGYYNGTIFHRVIPDFMIQGGGFGKDMVPKPTKEAIKNEADNGLSNIRGTVAMARTDAVDSATSQFFINVKDNLQLDHQSGNFGYAVIGEVVEGMDVVDAIRRAPTQCPSWTHDPGCDPRVTRGMRDVPKDAVVIIKATRARG